MNRLSAAQRHGVQFTLNGKPCSGEAEPRMLLTDFLRHQIGATGTHVGCEHGVCGACTLRVNGDIVRSCLMLAVQADNATVDFEIRRVGILFLFGKRFGKQARCNVRNKPETRGALSVPAASRECN